MNDLPKVVNIRKAVLLNDGYKNLENWLENPNHLYIGRNMSFYVAGANKSKWSNPFSVKKYGRDECLKKYEEYIRTTKDLFDSITELEGKKLGCWCCPEGCHGDILVKLFKEVCPTNP